MQLTNKAKENREKILPYYNSELSKTDPEFIEIFNNFLFDEVQSNTLLPERSQMLITLATLIANQSLKQYEIAVEAAINIGLKAVEIKEVQLTPQIGGHDMDTKARAAQKFLEAGNKVKVGVRFRGRQMTHIEVGQEVMDKFIALLSDYANIEKPSAMEGRWMYAILAPKKK